MASVPVAVVIPTYKRGSAVFSILEKIHKCEPRPAEIWIHIDQSDGVLQNELNLRFPTVKVLTSQHRIGPGGGRHRCLWACSMPIAVSLDDDSYPVDLDFFSLVARMFSREPDAAIVAAGIWNRGESPKLRTSHFSQVINFTGCGHAIRVSAYRQIRGYLQRAQAYGMEETDVSLQLFAAGWRIYQAGDLRVYHDTNLSHHQTAEVTAGVITNMGLYVFLNYPIVSWGWGLLQLGNQISYCIRMGRIRGIISGIARIPRDCYRHRTYRNPVKLETLRNFLRCRRITSE